MFDCDDVKLRTVVMVSLRPCHVSEGQGVKDRVMQAYTSLTAKAIGLIVFLLASTHKTKKI